MFTSNLITISFILMLASIPIAEFSEKKGWKFMLKFFGWIILISGLYCLFAGIWMVGDWVDPLVNATSEQISNVASHRKGGIVLFAIKFWPYILIVLGSLSVFIGKNLIMRKC